MTTQNQLILQSFEWHTPSNPSSSHYSRLLGLLPAFSQLGVTSLWLPPGCKANSPQGNGYDIYDLWDLGEFEQKGSRATKWGSREELNKLLKKARKLGVDVVWDAVLNHKAGADSTVETWAVAVDKEDRRYEIAPPSKIEAWLRFDFYGRRQEDESRKYSQFRWSAEHFNGTDWDHRERKNILYKLIDDPATLKEPFVQPRRTSQQISVPKSSGGRLASLLRRFVADSGKAEARKAAPADPARRPGKGWAEDVDKEHGNNDFLMFSNIDYTNSEVRKDTKDWGEWMIKDVGIDGFRLDAVQHFSFSYTKEWIQHVNDALRHRKQNDSKDAFIVGEVWFGDLSRITTWLDAVQHPSNHPQVYAFDAPLLYNFSRISEDIRNQSANIDLRTILRGSLLESKPKASVTLVTNHDTQPGQTMSTPMPRTLKTFWYAFILLREEGLPCVFWGDLFGTKGPHTERAVGVEFKDNRRATWRDTSKLAKLMLVRKKYAYGEQKDYWGSAFTIAWSRAGEAGGSRSGCVVILSVAPNSKTTTTKKIQVGQPGELWFDTMGHADGDVKIDAKGSGAFPVGGPGMSVFVKKDGYDLRVPDVLDGGFVDDAKFF